jgi:hypothetical protein
VYDVSRAEPEPQPLPCCVAGLDLGKLSDFSALAFLEWTLPPRPGPLWRADYAVTTLKRWPLGTAYLDIVGQLVRFFETLPPLSWPLLVLDATGVGGAVVEAAVRQMRDERSRGGWAAVTITAGDVITPRGGARWNVSKRQLVSHLQVVLGGRRLHVSPQLPEARVLLRELETFQVKISASGNEQFESWRERDHDDLVLAAALAVWAAEGGLAYQKLSRAAPPPRLAAVRR